MDKMKEMELRKKTENIDNETLAANDELNAQKRCGVDEGAVRRPKEEFIQSP